MESKDQEKCKHERKDRRGTTATTWRWTCKDCGKKEFGYKSDPTSLPSSSPMTASSASSMSSSMAALQVMKLMNATMEIQHEMGEVVDLNKLDKIYGKCRALVEHDLATSTPSTTKAEASRASSSSHTTWQVGDGSVMEDGVHKGKTFQHVYENEQNYTKGMLGKYLRDQLKSEGIKKYCQYAHQRQQAQKTAFMIMDQNPGMAEIDDVSSMVAVLDTGCNHTCHGQKWMERFMKRAGCHYEIESPTVTSVELEVKLK